jgi:hypothetical protein
LKMAKKKMYNILMKDRRNDPEGKLPWYRPVEGQCVGMQFVKGFVACERGYYPCKDIRIILCDENDPIRGEGTLVEEISGNKGINYPMDAEQKRKKQKEAREKRDVS